MKTLIICSFLLIFFPTTLYSQKVGDYYLLAINNIELPLNDKGILAGVDASSSAKFDDVTFLKSSGFYLSGLSNGILWANGVTSYDYAKDYLSGTYEFGENDPRAQLYKVSNQDMPFSQSWEDWVDAVELGAYFYDGNSDGNYNPIDINGNGQWEPNEDRPDLLGDEMLWCVYHDNKPDSERVWNTVTPQGIEIRQTVFAYANIETLENVIFVRYRILNKGLVAYVFEDSYFGLWGDPDLGDPNDDLIGCDIELVGGFAYNNEADSIYGNDPPSIFANFLSLPAAYIPGETYIDNDYNNIYTDGIDTPLDTAYSNQGQLLGVKTYPGAKNLNLSLSYSVANLSNDINLQLPQNKYEARNNMLGLTRFGDVADPCTFTYGEVFGVDCATVNPRRWFSGDPVITYGWLNIHPDNQMKLNSIGPFRLEADNEVELFVAYVVAQGTNPLNSITIARNIGINARATYYQNFNVISSTKDESPTISKYSLEQNYPNPFNSNTTIEYQIQEFSYVTLNIYDVLGNEIILSVNEEQPAGKYQIEFNASQLPSGVYYYRLVAGSFTQTEKMILLK